MPRILVTNDDGVHSAGIHALADALEAVGDVQVIAPDRERSAISHSFSMNHPIRARRINPRTTVIDGTPTDCVMFGVLGYLEEKPDLVVSGINTGPNLGDDVTYSGTVAAALEATMLKVPSFAISLGFRMPFGSEYADISHFRNAADFAQVLARDILENGIPQGTLLNVNVPEGNDHGVEGVRVTRLGKRVYRDQIYSREDPAGRTYYWIGGEEPGHVDEEGTDFRALEDGFISVTPMRYDLTAHALLEEFHARDLPARLNGQAS